MSNYNELTLTVSQKSVNLKQVEEDQLNVPPVTSEHLFDNLTFFIDNVESLKLNLLTRLDTSQTEVSRMN